MRDQTSISDLCENEVTYLGAQKRLKSRNCCCGMIALKNVIINMSEGSWMNKEI
jgi:hypothetical protein